MSLFSKKKDPDPIFVFPPGRPIKPLITLSCEKCFVLPAECGTDKFLGAYKFILHNGSEDPAVNVQIKLCLAQVEFGEVQIVTMGELKLAPYTVKYGALRPLDLSGLIMNQATDLNVISIMAIITYEDLVGGKWVSECSLEYTPVAKTLYSRFISVKSYQEVQECAALPTST